MKSKKKRIAYGIFGAIMGAGTTYVAMLMLGYEYIVPIIIVSVLCFVAAFFGGKRAIEYILKLDDYLD